MNESKSMVAIAVLVIALGVAWLQMPILAIVFGVLFLFAVVLPLPKPPFLDGNEQDKNKPSL
jgi:hypothetical protein